MKEQFEAEEHLHDEDGKRFLKLFEESTFEGSRAAVLEMKEIAKCQTKRIQKILPEDSIASQLAPSCSLLQLGDAFVAKHSPLLVLLVQVVDPNELSGNDPSVLYGNEVRPLQEGETRGTPLHDLTDLADP